MNMTVYIIQEKTAIANYVYLASAWVSNNCISLFVAYFVLPCFLTKHSIAVTVMIVAITMTIIVISTAPMMMPVLSVSICEIHEAGYTVRKCIVTGNFDISVK